MAAYCNQGPVGQTGKEDGEKEEGEGELWL
jgi:hypothetical protein